LLAANVQDTAEGTPLYSLYRRQRLAVPENSLVPPQPVKLAPQYLEVSCDPDPANSKVLYFNSPLDLTVPARRFGTSVKGLPNTNVPGYGLSYPVLAEQAADPGLRGADLILANVVSFDVRLLLAKQDRGYDGPADPRNPFIDLYDPSVDGYKNGNTALFAPDGPRVFDTWASTASTIPALDYSSWNAPGQPKSIPMWKASAPDNNRRGPVIRAVQITIRVWDVKTSLTRQVTIVQAM
jgi:hypothetical protein